MLYADPNVSYAGKLVGGIHHPCAEGRWRPSLRRPLRRPILTIAFRSQDHGAQHWYSSTGTPEHFRGPNGSSTTLREARKLNLCPSVTTVLDVLAKPGLEVWKRRQAVLAALTLPRMPDEPSEALLARIDADASRQAEEAATEGTAIHAAVEAGFAGAAVPVRHRPHWQAVQRMLCDNFNGVTDWVSEKRFAHPAGFGGCSDLHSPSTGVVIDFKGSAIRSGQDKKLAYDQNEQLGRLPVGAWPALLALRQHLPGARRTRVMRCSICGMRTRSRWASACSASRCSCGSYANATGRSGSRDHHT